MLQMDKSNATVGMKVYFGRSHGEKTLGEIVKLNPQKAKIRQLEDRGSIRDYKIGTIWTVPYNLMSPADPSAVPAPSVQTPASVTPPAAPKTFKAGEKVIFGKRDKIVGEVMVVNHVNLRVRQIGQGRHPDGAMWNVRPEACELAKDTDRTELPRAVLVNVLTGRRTVGDRGQDPEHLYEQLANGMRR